MASNARIRTSDADRDRAATELREHLAAGRLTVEEFDERLDGAFAAKTLGELDEVMADLPEVDLGQPPGTLVERSAAGAPPAQRPPHQAIQAGPDRFSPAWRAAWGSWLAISLVVVVIWLASSATGGLWFLWVVLAIGALLLGRWITGAPARGGRGRALPGRNHRHRHGRALR